MLNGIWLSFFIAAFAASLWQWLVGGDSEVFARLVQSLFDMAEVSVDIILVLLGTMTLWLGFLSIAEKAGLIRLLGRVLDPLFCRLMPEVPRGHPAMGLISMNFAANILGLDNAATPIGIKAMHSLQSLNPSSETASNAQILFLVLNTSSLTLLPVTIFMYRAQQGAADPTLVFLPILLATTASSLAGLLAVALMQRLKLWQPVVLAYLAIAALALGLLITTLAGMSAQALAAASTLVGGGRRTARQRRFRRWLRRYPLDSRRLWLGHPLCRCSPHRLCETAFWQRRPRHDDRNHGYFRRRQLRRATRGHYAR